MINTVIKVLNKIYYRLFSIIPKAILFFKKNVSVKRNVKFNRNTVFEGGNKIYKNCNISNTYIGFGTYLANDTNLPNCRIGRYNSIASHVTAIIGHHPLRPFVSTHPAFFSTLKQAGFTYVEKNKFNELKYADKHKKYSIIIGNDVWIGFGAKLMEGIRIEDGSIIAAGSVVTKDVPPFEIWGGVPAKKIKDRFPNEEKDRLLKIKWWNKDESLLKRNVDKFENVDKFNLEV
jgi:acetyltransferase-like isoleucine patch superfamily enzyme